MPAAHGASVVLRLNGEIVGRGSDFPAPPALDAEPDPLCLARAAAAAIAEADRRLPVPRDALRDEAARQLASDLTISLELAGPLTPLLPSPRTYADADAIISPGIDGLAAQLSERRTADGPPAARAGRPPAVIFPGTLLATNTSVTLALASLAGQVSGDSALGLLEPAELASRHDIRFFRFPTVHLVQAARAEEPVVLYRGARLIDQASITSAALREMADRAAAHLISTLPTPPAKAGADASVQLALGPRGTYDPTRDAYEPKSASPIEQLVAAIALRAFARDPGAPPERAAAAEIFIEKTIADLRTVEVAEPDPLHDPVACAAWIVLGDAPEQAAPRMQVAFDPDAGFDAKVPTPAQSLIALALVELAAKAPEPARSAAIQRASDAVRRIFRDTPTAQLVAQMPWLGDAELRLAALTTADIPSAVALRDMRDQVWEHRVTALDPIARDTRAGGPDLVGGIVFARGAPGGALITAAARPTWQSVRPLAFIAAMLPVDSLTKPDERDLELASLLSAVRFLRQLQADDLTCWMYPAPSRAIGGVRAAPWDQRMPPDATSLTLLTVCRTLEAIGRAGHP
jgi:hypothetical protein